MVDVDFQHWSETLSRDALLFGSPYFDEKSARDGLVECARRDAQKHPAVPLTFDGAQLLCANEAFPEAAVADPLADLDVWDEWRSGIRAFPYPGRYSRLGIRAQEPKTQSPSSVGVVGEIMAGLFAQSGIAPWILVRVIRRWPDFIFYMGDGTYAFVESKAFTMEERDRNLALGDRVPVRLLGDCLLNAALQLNADPAVTVWGAFTGIMRISPLELQVTFLELQPTKAHRTSAVLGMLPEAVVTGLAEQAVSHAIVDLPEDVAAALRERPGKTKSQRRREAERRLAQMSEIELEALLTNAGPEKAVSASRGSLTEKIRKLLSKWVLSERGEGARLAQAKEVASLGRLARVRGVGAGSVFVADLERGRREQVFHSAWKDANQPWGHAAGVPLWRCGGSVFSLTSHDLSGMVPEVSRTGDQLIDSILSSSPHERRP